MLRYTRLEGNGLKNIVNRQFYLRGVGIMKNKKKIDILSPCALVRFSKKTGKVDTTLKGTGYAVLNLWGLQNTTKTKESFVFTTDTGLMLSHYTGSESGIPEVEWYENDENIADYCEGDLLDAVRR